MKKIVLLTGATGFVGRQILRIVGVHNYSVRLVVRSGAAFSIDPSVSIDRIIETPDLFAESNKWWEEACEGVDMIIHCAWYAEPGKYLQSSKNIDCLIGTLNFAKGAAAAAVRRFVGIGTCFEYELISGRLSTETALKPQTPYASSKAAAFLELSKEIWPGSGSS